MPQATTPDTEKPVRPSPYSPLGILRQALASPNVRRGDGKGDSAAVASLRASAVKRLVPLLKSQLARASPLGEATGATQREEK
ncbi:hypothetical protein [uncultured Nostoc sp.]|uniref:hypothetical protein n=1 Tax=uncultured Nostoc sp. TaxID=340711 RepID=UPI0035CA2AF0